MLHNCCVYKCTCTSATNPDLHFFEVPKEKKARKNWQDRIRREDWEPSKWTTVCSRHFLPSDIRPPNLNTPEQFRKTKLKAGVLPHLNLRGEENDGRARRPTKTAMKARSSDETPSSSITVNDEDFSLHNHPPFSNDDYDETDQLRKEVEELGQKLLASQGKSDNLEILLTESRKDSARLLKEVNNLNGKLFRYVNLSPEQIQQYSNVDKNAFDTLAEYLKRFEPVAYWSGAIVNSISHYDQLLICLMKLKFNSPLYDLADRYSVTRTTISNVYMTYLHLIHEVVFKAILNKIPSVEKNRCCLPDSFGDFSNCRIIIDCTEFTVEKPRTKLNSASLLFSNYKHNLTVKYLIGVAPNSAVTYISEGYMGSISDKMVTDDSGVLSHLKAGDLILADKGFLLHDIIPQGVFLNLPAFLRGKQKFTREEAIFSRKIARSRIHVERAIGRMRDYTILNKIHSKERWYCDIIVQVCGALVNIQSPLIHDIFNNDSNDADNIDFVIG